MFNQLQIHDGNGCQDHFLDKILNNFSVNEKKTPTGLDSRARQTPIIVSTEQIKVPNKNLITSACVGLALTEIKAFFSPLTSLLPPPKDFYGHDYARAVQVNEQSCASQKWERWKTV